MTDILSDKAVSPLEFFRLKVEETESRVNRANLQRALDALSEFVGGEDISFDDFNENLLGELVVRLLYRGNTPKTISNNVVKRLATLYNKAVDEGLARPTEAFTQLKDKLDSFQLPDLPYTFKSEVFRKIQKLIRTDFSGNPQRQLAKDMLLFAIFNGGLTFDQIANYRKTDYTGSNPAISEIVDRYSKPKNKYLFPLNQAHSTSKQLGRFLKVLLSDILSQVQLSPSAIPAYTAGDLWCAIALSCGVAASDVVRCISAGRAASVIASFAIPSDLSDEEVEQIRENIISTLTKNPLHWYVMQFRPRVNYDMVKDRLKDRKINLVETYYPMEEVTRKVGNKKVFESRPVISWLLFFRERVTELNKLYHEIGDLAWGYRNSKTLGSQYAVISQAEILNYKLAIGDLGENTEIYPEGAVQLRPGDRLVVLGGLLGGRPGTFDSVVKSDADGGRTICRILLDGGRYKDWIADQDIRLVKKISESKFDELRRQI